MASRLPQWPPQPGLHPTFARDHEYKRHGTVTLMAGIDLMTGKVHALVKDRHRSRECLIWTIGNGRVLSLRAGHEGCPIFYMPEMRRLSAT